MKTRADEVSHQHARAVLRLDQRRAATGVPRMKFAGRINRCSRSMKTSASRWSQAWLPRVTQSAPGIEEFVADRFRDADGAGGILAVDHHAIELPALTQRGEVTLNRLAAGFGDHIAQKQNAHQQDRL